MIKRLMVILLLCSFIQGCPRPDLYRDIFFRLKVEPNVLPRAQVGKPYFINIKIADKISSGDEILSGKVSLISLSSLKWDKLDHCLFIKGNLDEKTLVWNPGEKKCVFELKNDKESKYVRWKTKIDKIEDEYNHLIISGIPKNKGVLEIWIYGYVENSGSNLVEDSYKANLRIIVEE